MSDMLFRELLNIFLHGDMKILLSAPFMKCGGALLPSTVVEFVKVSYLPMSRSFLTSMKREHRYGAVRQYTVGKLAGILDERRMKGNGFL